jgi:hypothetical protein
MKTMNRKAGVVCVAKNCKNKKYTCHFSFFTFPKDRQRYCMSGKRVAADVPGLDEVKRRRFGV